MNNASPSEYSLFNENGQITSGAYRAGEVGEGARNCVLCNVDGEIQTLRGRRKQAKKQRQCAAVSCNYTMRY